MADGRSSTRRVVESADTKDEPARRRYSVEYKVAILAEYEGLDRAGKGVLLRRERLYTSLLSEWRKQRDQGAVAALTGRPGRPAFGLIARENARLRSRAQRLESELERTRHVIESQTKLATQLDQLDTDKQHVGSARQSTD